MPESSPDFLSDFLIYIYISLGRILKDAQLQQAAQHFALVLARHADQAADKMHTYIEVHRYREFYGSFSLANLST